MKQAKSKRPKLPQRHFFNTYGGEGVGVAYTDNNHFWKIMGGMVVDFTSDHDILREWKREMIAATKAKLSAY